jgi:serine/threonine protein kinase
MLDFWLATWDILKQIISYLWTISSLVVSYLMIPLFFLISICRSNETRQSIFTCGRTKHKKNQLSKEFKDLVLSMIAYDASERPSLTELKEKPWVISSEGLPTLIEVKNEMSALKHEFTVKEIQNVQNKIRY